MIENLQRDCIFARNDPIEHGARRQKFDEDAKKEQAALREAQMLAGAGAGTRGRRRTQFEPEDFGDAGTGPGVGRDVSGEGTITLNEVATGTSRRVHLLGNGIDLERFTPTAVPIDVRRRVRAEWGIGFNEVVISKWSMDYQRFVDADLKITADTDLALPELAKTRGTVLNIVSNASHMPMTTSLAYNASKGAAHIMTLQLARELTKKHGITVFGISPNKLRGTEMSKDIEDQVVKHRGWTKEYAEQYQLNALLAGCALPT